MDIKIYQSFINGLLNESTTEKSLLDIISDLSVPILSLTALIITFVFSFKQWLLMKYEYKLKLYPDRYEIFNYLTEVLIGIDNEDFLGNKNENAILNIEKKMFLYNKDVIQLYIELIDWIKKTDKTANDFDKNNYKQELKNKLSTLIDLMRQYLTKFYIEIK